MFVLSVGWAEAPGGGGEIYFARMFFQEHVLRVDAEQRVAGGEITVRSSAQKLL